VVIAVLGGLQVAANPIWLKADQPRCTPWGLWCRIHRAFFT